MLLILTDDSSLGIELCEHLLSRGLFSYRAELDCGRSLCERLDTSGVLLDGRSRPAVAESLCRELLSLYPELPILFLCTETTVTNCLSARLVRCGSTSSDEIARLVLSFAEQEGWKPRLSTYALTLTSTPKETRFLGYPLPLTPREHAILGFLFYSAPKTLPQHLLLSVCFPRGCERAENLGVHVSAINKRAERLAGIPLIECCYGVGYRLHPRVFSGGTAEKC